MTIEEKVRLISSKLLPQYKRASYLVDDISQVAEFLRMKHIVIDGERWHHWHKLHTVKDGIVYMIQSRRPEYIDTEGEFFLVWDNNNDRNDMEYIFFNEDELPAIMLDIAPLREWVMINPQHPVVAKWIDSLPRVAENER